MRRAGMQASELSLLVLVALIAATVAAGLVLLLWPEAGSVVRSGD